MNDIRIYTHGEYFTVKSKTFSGGEVHVNLNILPHTLYDCQVICHLQSSDDVMNMLLVINALHHRYPNLRDNINVVIPYMPYARQDRVCAPGDALSIQVFGQLLQTARIRLIYTYDLHSRAAFDILSKYVRVAEYDQYHIFSNSKGVLRPLISDTNIILAAPDKGAVPKIEQLNNNFRNSGPILLGVKQRDPTTGNLTGFDYSYSESIDGRDVLIVDDICDGGGTFVGLAEKLKRDGARKIMLYVTHGIFSRGLEPFEGMIDHVFTTDSFRHKTLPTSDKVQLTVVHF